MIPSVDSARLRARLAELDWTPTRAAAEAGLPHSFCGDVLARNWRPEAYAVEHLAEALGVSVAWLRGTTNDRERRPPMSGETEDQYLCAAKELMRRADELLDVSRNGRAARIAAGESGEIVGLGPSDPSSSATPETTRLNTLDAVRNWGSASAPNRIRELRESKGLSVEALAEQVGCGRRMLADLEAGKYRSRIATIIRLCAALGVGIVEIGIFGRYVPPEQREGSLEASTGVGGAKPYQPRATDVADLIAQFGGLVPFSACASVSVDEAARWARESAIPVVYWLGILAAAEDQDIPLAATDLIWLHDEAAAHIIIDPRWPAPAGVAGIRPSPTSLANLIHLMGGTVAVGTAIDEDPDVVGNWVEADRVPWDQLPCLLSAADNLGINTGARIVWPGEQTSHAD